MILKNCPFISGVYYNPFTVARIVDFIQLWKTRNQLHKYNPNGKPLFERFIRIVSREILAPMETQCQICCLS